MSLNHIKYCLIEKSHKRGHNAIVQLYKVEDQAESIFLHCGVDTSPLTGEVLLALEAGWSWDWGGREAVWLLRLVKYAKCLQPGVLMTFTYWEPWTAMSGLGRPHREMERDVRGAQPYFESLQPRCRCLSESPAELDPQPLSCPHWVWAENRQAVPALPRLHICEQNKTNQLTDNQQK